MGKAHHSRWHAERRAFEAPSFLSLMCGVPYAAHYFVQFYAAYPTPHTFLFSSMQRTLRRTLFCPVLCSVPYAAHFFVQFYAAYPTLHTFLFSSMRRTLRRTCFLVERVAIESLRHNIRIACRCGIFHPKCLCHSTHSSGFFPSYAHHKPFHRGRVQSS